MIRWLVKVGFKHTHTPLCLSTLYLKSAGYVATSWVRTLIRAARSAFVPLSLKEIAHCVPGVKGTVGSLIIIGSSLIVWPSTRLVACSRIALKAVFVAILTTLVEAVIVRLRASKCRAEYSRSL